MPLVHLVLILALVGFLTWLLLTYVPMQPPFKTIILAVIVIVTVLFVLQAFGLLDGLTSMRVGGQRHAS